jgi:hypothetical protein
MKLKLLLAITSSMMICLFGNLAHGQPAKTVSVPDFVTSVPLGHFAGISPPAPSIDQARKLAVLDVIRQVLSAIGIEYHHSFTDLISGTPYNPKRIINDQLSGAANGVVLGVDQNIVQSSWCRDGSGKYIFFVLVHYPYERIANMRKLSKGPRVTACLISISDNNVRLKVSQVNGIPVMISSAVMMVQKRNRFAKAISFFVWHVPSGSDHRVSVAIDPVHICTGSREIMLPFDECKKSLSDYLLGANIQHIVVLKGYDDLGREVSAKVVF